jgi:hypothetical protein
MRASPGLAPNAEPWFFSEVNQSTCAPPTGSTRATAIANAINHLRAGDVLLLEMQTSISLFPSLGSALVPAELDYRVWNLTRTATHSGIVVVAAAGNGVVNLDRTDVDALNLWRARNDSGAIIVGAGSPDTNHDRFFFYGAFGSRVDVQGWGSRVFSLGYGNFANLAPGDPDGKQTYTDTFNGTSSATAVVSGAVAGLQSLRWQNQLPLYNSVQMRNLLKNTGWAQGTYLSGNIGPFPNVAKAILQLGIGANDCNANGIPDECESFVDCNYNGVPDSCDISGRTSCDLDADGVPDECQTSFAKGACCLSATEGDCIVTTQCGCDNAYGNFVGVGARCSTINCLIIPMLVQPGGPDP